MSESWPVLFIFSLCHKAPAAGQFINALLLLPHWSSDARLTVNWPLWEWKPGWLCQRLDVYGCFVSAVASPVRIETSSAEAPGAQQREVLCPWVTATLNIAQRVLLQEPGWFVWTERIIKSDAGDAQLSPCSHQTRSRRVDTITMPHGKQQ